MNFKLNIFRLKVNVILSERQVKILSNGIKIISKYCFHVEKFYFEVIDPVFLRHTVVGRHATSDKDLQNELCLIEKLRLKWKL